MIKLSKLIDLLEQIAPRYLAEENDPIGLQIGDVNRDINKICVAVDPSVGVIRSAIDKKADVIISHHPLIFMPLKTLTNSQPEAGRVIDLIKANIAFYAAHTNYDAADGGINDVLAEVLGIRESSPIHITCEEKLYKIAVFVPVDSVDEVIKAITDAGAGHIGNYSNCTFRSPGIGTFLPLEGTNPYIGKAGKLEEVEEVKLESVFPAFLLNDVVKAMLSAHPYEEPAYDVFELVNKPLKRGYGRIGEIEKEMRFAEFAEIVKNSLKLDNMRVRGDAEKIIKKAAVCGGAGGSLFEDVFRMGADVYVTGDIRSHEFVNAEALGLAMIDAGHFETEKPGMVSLASVIKKKFESSGIKVEYIE